MWLASKIGWGIARDTKVSSNLTITYGVPPFSHNVVTKQNMATSWIPEMANHYEKLHPLKPHYPTIKTKKKLIYNYYATIPWVLQLLCNYPLKNMVH
jgi:hypothetical protein